ncbi:hypothetical protein Tco_0466034 [Tanacetum coccineum]
MNTKTRQKGKVPCSKDSEAEDGAHPSMLMVISKMAIIEFDRRSSNCSLVLAYRSIAVIMEYLVKISKKACILELKRRNMKKTNSDIQYAVSIKKDTAYLCLHFTKDHEGNKINTPYPENPICRIQAMEIKYSRRY